MQSNRSNPKSALYPRTTPARAAFQSQPPTVPSAPSAPAPSQRQPKRPSKKLLIIAGVIVLLAVAAFAVWQYASSQIMADRYQAVFLNNGQVYFGKLHDYYGGRPYMTDVYYFQANSQTGNSSQSGAGNQLLVKLGQEIHAPENKLILNKDSIMFVENLTNGGKVTEAMKKDAQGSSAATGSSGGVTR